MAGVYSLQGYNPHSTCCIHFYNTEYQHRRQLEGDKSDNELAYDDRSLSRTREGSEDASSFLLPLKLTFNPEDNTQDIITFPRTLKMRTITMLPLGIALLTPINPDFQGHQLALAYTCLALPLLYASILLYAKSTLFTAESIFAIIYRFSLFQRLAPSILAELLFPGEFLNLKLTFPADMVLTAVFCFLSAIAITVLVGAIMSPPKRFDYKDKSDYRFKMEAQTLYLFHIYTVPLQLWAVLEYLTMIHHQIHTVNKWASGHQMRAFIVGSMPNASDYWREMFLNSLSFSVVTALIVPIPVVLASMLERVMDANNYLKDITYPYSTLQSVRDPYDQDLTYMEERYSFGAWERGLRWAEQASKQHHGIKGRVH